MNLFTHNVLLCKECRQEDALLAIEPTKTEQRKNSVNKKLLKNMSGRINANALKQGCRDLKIEVENVEELLKLGDDDAYSKLNTVLFEHEVLEGILKCVYCGMEYSIRDKGIVDML